MNPAPGLQHCSGQIVTFYLFDVAERADLSAIPTLIGGPTVPARLAPKPATPAYVQYETPPVSFDGEVAGTPEIAGFRTRVRVYDYGVISIALTRQFAGAWDEFVALAPTVIENDELERSAEAFCRTVVQRLAQALPGHRERYLSEDYTVFALYDVDPSISADALIDERGRDIARMLRGERRTLSAQETTTILSHRLSYMSDDLVIPTWNAAFVRDTPAGVQAAMEIMEFANSQLLEFRYYDQLLDRELGSIYARLPHPRWFDQWLGSRYVRAARQVHSLYIDVNELTDRTENALKFIGDIYAVRLFRLVAERLGLATWKADVDAKLKTLDDIYRFAADQASMARGQFLELTIVLILILELVLFFMGVMT